MILWTNELPDSSETTAVSYLWTPAHRSTASEIKFQTQQIAPDLTAVLHIVLRSSATTTAKSSNFGEEQHNTNLHLLSSSAVELTFIPRALMPTHTEFTALLLEAQEELSSWNSLMSPDTQKQEQVCVGWRVSTVPSGRCYRSDDRREGR